MGAHPVPCATSHRWLTSHRSHDDRLCARGPIPRGSIIFKCQVDFGEQARISVIRVLSIACTWHTCVALRIFKWIGAVCRSGASEASRSSGDRRIMGILLAQVARQTEWLPSSVTKRKPSLPTDRPKTPSFVTSSVRKQPYSPLARSSRIGMKTTS